jgi:hypothetical protein
LESGTAEGTFNGGGAGYDDGWDSGWGEGYDIGFEDGLYAGLQYHLYGNYDIPGYVAMFAVAQQANVAVPEATALSLLVIGIACGWRRRWPRG